MMWCHCLILSGPFPVSVYDHAELKTIEGAGHGFYSGEPFTISTQYTTDFLLDQIKE